MRSQSILLLCAAAVACTPRLNGTCKTTADCHAGESCSPEGLCLDPSAINNADGGNTTASITVLSPADGAIEKGTFHVAAQATSAIAIQGVTFVLTNSASGASIGQVDVTTAVGATWSGDLTLSAAAFGGAADLKVQMHRAGLPDVTSSPVRVTVDQNAPSISASWAAGQWFALDAGFLLTAAVSDDRSGVASAAAVLLDGGTTPGTITAGVATFAMQASAMGTPGAATQVPVSLSAADLAGNQALTSSTPTIGIDDQPPTVTVPAFDPAVWHNGKLAFTATLNDGAGSGPGSASLLINGAFVAGQPDAGGVFTFQTDLSTALPATESAVVLQVIGTDVVGNQGDGGITISVDNVPPVVSGAAIDSAGDFTDLAGKAWFKGPSIAAGADVKVSAGISDPHLLSVPAPAAVVGASSIPGTLTAGRWGFAIPRSAGLGAKGAVNVAFDAQDAAGNHPAPSSILPINFDDQATFPASPSSDPAFHGPSELVTVTVSTAPPSGFPVGTGVVDFARTAKLSLGSCTGASAISADSASSVINTYPTASTLAFKVPMSCAPANTDGPVTFSVTVNSLVGGTGTASGSINVDTKGPVIGDVVVLYPASAAGTPLGWSYDGAHFQRRDSGALFSFAAYDCHGLSASLPVVSGLPGATVAQAADARGVLVPTCTPPGGVHRYTVTANLALLPSSSVPNEDNTPGWSATLKDAFGNQGSASGTVAVTRRMWRASPPTALSYLALGPRLIASALGNATYSFDPANGSAGTWANSSEAPLIAPNAGTPALIYSQGSSVVVGNAAASTTSNFGSCFHGDFLDGFQLVGDSTVGYQSHTDTTTCIPTCIDCSPAPKCSCAACMNVTTTNFNDTVVLSGGAVQCSANAKNGGLACSGAPSGPAALTNRISNANPVSYVGLSGGTTWVLANSAGATADSVGGLVSPTWPLIDGSNPPIVYLPGVGGAGQVATRVITAAPVFAPAGFAVPNFGASPISDMLLSKNGILYVLSNGVVYAAITDSSGGATALGGTQVSAWPSQCRDPCRTSNSGIQCPY